MLNDQNKHMVELYFLAHARSGDKGNTLSIAVIAYENADYELLAQELTADRVRAWLGTSVRGDVVRYDLPRLHAFNFVLNQALDGGVSESLSLDTHGKTRSGVLLSLPVLVPENHPALELKRRYLNS